MFLKSFFSSICSILVEVNSKCIYYIPISNRNENQLVKEDLLVAEASAVTPFVSGSLYVIFASRKVFIHKLFCVGPISTAAIKI